MSGPALSEAPQGTRVAAASGRSAPVRRARLGFLGAGWIGKHRLRAIADADVADIVFVGDASQAALKEFAALLPGVALEATPEAMFRHPIDGLVIATPSALHATQAIEALQRGIAVFCQKPLARTAEEAGRVVAAARNADVLLGVDFSYRHTQGMRRIRELVAQGRLGQVYAVDLVFHNAYGPDKPWFHDMAQSGGGCLMDLGIHLIDLALWALDRPRVLGASGTLWKQGQRLAPGCAEVEDHAVAELELEGGTLVRLACSWNLAAGRDAVIEADFHGTQAGAAMHNVKGSFFDFVAERFDGTQATLLAAPPDDWGGRAAVRWARELAVDGRYDPAIEQVVDVAAVLDALYGR